jgi:tRNA dimethylallyltransferase
VTAEEKQKPQIVVICGPTGVGKTAIVIELARALGGEIVSADSMQIYRYMDIGTAKPTPEERAAAPHHMIDIADPDEPFDAARYASLARSAIGAIIARGRLPLVAGGTGFYIRALVGGLFDAGASDPEIRDRLRQEVETEGADALYRRLESRDPLTAGTLHPNDTFRIIRALEIFEVTGNPLSIHQQQHAFRNRPYDVLALGLEMDRQRLYERIDRRVDIMMDAGFLEEVEHLLARGYGPGLKSMQSIGYRHMVDLIQGSCDRETALATMKRDTRRYAKRQLTWFRGDAQVVWVGVDQPNDILKRIREFLFRT